CARRAHPQSKRSNRTLMAQTVDRPTQPPAHMHGARRSAPHVARTPTVPEDTLGGLPLRAVYGPDDVQIDVERDLAEPGEFPYTRGVHQTMYRDKLWTMRQFAGFGSAAETNERYRFLLSQGQMGLSVAFDMPTLMGHDSDARESLGEVGRCGVAIDSVEDMRTLFNAIDVGDITTSMTINSPAPILFAMYLAVAEETYVPFTKLGGTLQNDILKEYIAQKEFIFPVQPSMRLVSDVVAFCAQHVPRWHPISISGYHIREAGSTAAQELAFTLADGFTYVEAGIAAGLEVDEVAPRPRRCQRCSAAPTRCTRTRWTRCWRCPPRRRHRSRCARSRSWGTRRVFHRSSIRWRARGSSRI